MFSRGEIHFFSTVGVSLLFSVGVILFVLGILMGVFAVIENFKEKSLFELMPYYRDYLIIWFLVSLLGIGLSVFTVLYFM
jgi:hypothetical protein